MFTAPTVAQILLDLRNTVRSEVPGTDPWSWPNNLVPTLKALAQALRSAYLRLQFIHEQAFVSTARAEYLDFHGIQTGGLSRNPAGYAQGKVTVGINVSRVTIPDGIALYRSDNIQFQTVGSTTLVRDGSLINVRALETGDRSNTDTGAILYPVIPIAGVTTLVVSDSGLIGGSDEESDDSFRQRILFIKQNPPHGGSPSEYQEWAQTKTGVTRVFPMRATPGPGSATIYFMMDGLGNGVPPAAHVADLQSILNELAPADADVIVSAPIPVPINITVSNLKPNTPTMRDAIASSIAAQFVRKAVPASITEPSVFSKSWITEAIASTPKWVSSMVTVPAGDVTLSTPGQLPILGTITWG
jgi:uncharacterized phage protein gp47/JayE